MEPQSDDPLEGTPYRTLAPLGAGAMGEVLLAEHVALRRRVVVKVLKAELAGSPKTLDRARLEAQAVAALRHPNIVAALDFAATRDGRPFFVMEHLEGETLLDLVRREGAIEPRLAIAIVRQVLGGLGEAHRVGIVHRDVKPGNLFRCSSGAVKILDFGIAKVLATAATGDAPSPLAFPTDEGIALGSPRYLSPEQALGKPVDRRADIYGAGAVLYYLLAGRDPFHHRRGVFELLKAHAQESPAPPSTHAPDVPSALDDVVLRALEKRPADRWPDTDAFASALDRAEKNPGGPGSQRPPRWERTIPIGPEVLRALRDAYGGELPPEPPITLARSAEETTAPIALVVRRSRPSLPLAMDDETTTMPLGAAALSGGDPDADTAPARPSPWARGRPPFSRRLRGARRSIGWAVGLLAALALIALLLAHLKSEMSWSVP